MKRVWRQWALVVFPADRGHQTMFYDDKVFGPLTLLNMLRLGLLFAAFGVVVYTLQLIAINDAAHRHQKELNKLQSTVCTLIESSPQAKTDKGLLMLAHDYHCGGSS